VESELVLLGFQAAIIATGWALAPAIRVSIASRQRRRPTCLALGAAEDRAEGPLL
jgi:hypothetical protein